jgi:hypothetical protein
MTGLLAYGSLIHPGEHADLPGLRSVHPVLLSGWRRVFHQTPSWRRGEGKEIAVLDLISTPGATLPLILLCFDEIDFAELDRRERGYLRIGVEEECIASHGGGERPLLRSLHLYTGRPELRDPALLPNPDYLALCLEGAAYWGEEFYRGFLESTTLGNGEMLGEYLEKREKLRADF